MKPFTPFSTKRRCVLYKITDDNWIAVDLVKYETNDLGTYENIKIQFKSGKVMKTEPKKLETKKATTIKTSGYSLKKDLKEIFLKAEEIILFFNNYAHQPNLKDAESIYLEDLWDIKEKIRWDRDKSKKKVFIFCENEPSDTTQATKIDAANTDYIFPIWDPSITNSIKNYEVFQTQNTKEREQLHADYEKLFSEIRRVYGIRHLTSKKEERQNNPEVELNESQFIALERDKKRERLKSIKDFEAKSGCKGEHTLTYGTAPEQREEKVLEIKELEQAKAEPNTILKKTPTERLNLNQVLKNSNASQNSKGEPN